MFPVFHPDYQFGNFVVVVVVVFTGIQNVQYDKIMRWWVSNLQFDYHTGNIYILFISECGIRFHILGG